MGERDYFRHDWSDAPRMPFWATRGGTKALLFALGGIHFLLLLLEAAAPQAAFAARRFLELHPEDVLQRFHVWQIVTATLVHGGFWHLLWNCLMLFFMGGIVEDRLGTRRFLLFCLGAAVSASLLYLAWGVLTGNVATMVGASGAVVGLLCLAALQTPRLTILLFGIWPMPLWVLAAFVVFFDLFMTFSLASTDIAHTAHLGGALYAWIHHRFGARVGGVFGAIDRAAARQRRRKELRRQAEDAELRREVDRILDKVNREGMAALTSQERRFLKQASERLRR